MRGWPTPGQCPSRERAGLNLPSAATWQPGAYGFRSQYLIEPVKVNECLLLPPVWVILTVPVAPL